MADITTIRKSVSKMSDDEIDALIQERRASRRTVMSQSKSKRSSTSKKTKKSKNPKKGIMTSLASMSDEEKQKLKEMLE